MKNQSKAKNYILVVKVNMFMHPKEFDNILKYIRGSVETGVVVLPPYCDAKVVPSNIEVLVEGETI